MSVCEEAGGGGGGGVERVTVSSALPCFPLFTARILSVCCSLMAFNEPPVNPSPSCLHTTCQARERASERKRHTQRERESERESY